ncbi:DUF3786 domain-containing protein [Thermodesulfobacteriota bacterium]
MDNYTKIARGNLDRLYRNLSDDLANNLPGEKNGDRFWFKAFGEQCCISPEGISIDNKTHDSVLGILISLYALSARPDGCILEPLKAFKEFPDSMPYVGAFASHTENLLIPVVSNIKRATSSIMEKFCGKPSPVGTGGDFSFVVFPLPKIALCYIFYEADDEFPASVTCLFSNNARLFLSMDGLADVGEYTSRTILELVEPKQRAHSK